MLMKIENFLIPERTPKEEKAWLKMNRIRKEYFDCVVEKLQIKGFDTISAWKEARKIIFGDSYSNIQKSNEIVGVSF